MQLYLKKREESSRLSCKSSAERHSSHAVLNDIIKLSLQSSGIASILELVRLDRGESTRTDCIVVF